jgi:CDP-glucose 4,6-dehydratase
MLARMNAVDGMIWRDRSVLITGATGFVGSWLTHRLLDEGARVVAIVADVQPDSEFARSRLADRVTVIDGLLQDARVVDRAVLGDGVDTVFHLGAQTIVGTAHRDPVATFEANIRGTYLLLDACRRAGPAWPRVVVASSDKAYGTVAELPYTESTPLHGRQPYEVSKSCTDLLGQSYATTYGLPVAIARCGNIYGGGDLNWSRIVPGTIRSLLRREVPVIRSDGTLVRDYLHVDDVVDAYLALAAWLEQPAAGADEQGIAFNFSDESPRTVLEIYESICAAAGSHVEARVLGEASTEIPEQHLDATRAREVLGWKCAVDEVEGLQRAIAWYRELLAST